jgi:hypothetical protein
MNKFRFYGGLIVLSIGVSSLWAAKPKEDEQPPLTEFGQRIEAHYAKQMEDLRSQLLAKIPYTPALTPSEKVEKEKIDFSDTKGGKKGEDLSLEELLGEEDGGKPGQGTPEKKERTQEEIFAPFMSSDLLDELLVKYVVLLESTPRGLAGFAPQGKEHFALVEQMLADSELMKQMLIADGAKAKRMGRSGYGPARYGEAMKIYADIRKASKKSSAGVLHRLALAIGLEHAVPIEQSNPTVLNSAPATIDPVKRYLHYEKAFINGELDSTFKKLSTWDLRMVVNGDEPDETLNWGRRMLRNYRPDHIYNSNFGWRYVAIVGSDVKYGSGDVKYDRPELQKYQNILMNGGVCGRRAFFGRFILRSFGGTNHGTTESRACRLGSLDTQWLVRQPWRRLGSRSNQYAL